MKKFYHRIKLEMKDFYNTFVSPFLWGTFVICTIILLVKASSYAVSYVNNLW